MAEFTEVMRQAKRMCAAHGGMCNSRNCPLDNGEACRLATDQDGEDYSDVERIIMDWVAEHPDKPVPERCSCYSGAHEQGWPNRQVQTLYGGGEVNLDAPPGRYPLVCQSTREAEPRRKAIFTVAIKDLACEEMDIWTSAFSTRELAEEFMRAVRRKLAAYGVTTVQVCLDAGDLDGDVYLSWLDDRYGGEDDDN